MESYNPRNYRPDIDGLRAIAVLGVLAFHAFPAALPGGFAGVDVFFVISGFLISGIILQDLQERSFSFAEFYRRRARRLFPALVVVLLASLAVGWLVFLPHEFAQHGRHVAAGAAFLSNIVFWREAGYFDTAAELKPLLHLWSLGVEEQYYLVWPLVLFLFRRRAGWTLLLIAAVAASSFAANIWLTEHKPVAGFYLPVGRLWEFLAGSLLAYFVHHGRAQERWSEAKATAGAVLILGSFAILSGSRAFPGWWALLPVAGTVLAIWAGPSAWINRKLLCRPALVWVGLISYPLYLWHWPVLVYGRIAHGGEPPAAVRLALCALSVLLAWLTYALVEKRIRFATLPSVRRLSVPGLAASVTAIGAVGFLALRGVIGPLSAASPLACEISAAYSDWEYHGDRVIPGDTGKAVVLFGDSHMQHYWPRIQKLADEHAAPMHTIILRTAGGCAPVPGIEQQGSHCAPFVDETLQLAQRPEVETVVIAASWVGFLERAGRYYRVGDPERKPLKLLTPESEWVLHRFQAALARLVAAGKKVVIVLSSPRGRALSPVSLVRREGMVLELHGAPSPIPRAQLSKLTHRIDSRLRRIADAVGATVVDPTEWLCTATACPSTDERGRPMYKDATHLRARFVRERFLGLDRFVYPAEVASPKGRLP